MRKEPLTKLVAVYDVLAHAEDRKLGSSHCHKCQHTHRPQGWRKWNKGKDSTKLRPTARTWRKARASGAARYHRMTGCRASWPEERRPALQQQKEKKTGSEVALFRLTHVLSTVGPCRYFRRMAHAQAHSDRTGGACGRGCKKARDLDVVPSSMSIICSEIEEKEMRK